MQEFGIRDGVAWAGSPPAGPGGSGQQQQAINISVCVNQKAVTVEAVVYAADRKQLRAIVVRV